MGKTIDRTGERGINNFGSEMVIVGYRGRMDIDVSFPQYNWTTKGVRYETFKKGQIKCPYEKRVYGIGYLGEGEYKSKENGKMTKCYDTWHSMLERCYSDKLHEKYPTYIGCEADEDWLCFQNYGEWFDNNYYEIEDERMHLDKDILVKHNKIYSPETCIFVPDRINTLFVKCDNARGDSPVGTSLKNGKYQVNCSLINPKTGKSRFEYLGLYDTQEKGFEVYKYYKEKNIKEVADYYKGQIPQKVYDALYKYEVKITD